MVTAGVNPTPRDTLQLAGVGVLLAFVAALQVSIAASEILLFLLVPLWGIWLLARHQPLETPRMFIPLIAYAGITLASAAVSSDPRVSLLACKQLVLFMLVPVVYQIARGSRAFLVVQVIVGVGAASAALGIVQYAVLGYDNLAQRPHGVMSHYMTYSGLLMLVICAATARVLFSRWRIWPALAVPVLLVALGLTFTRSAWVGTGVAVALLLSLKDIRLVAVLPVMAALSFAVAPHRVADRFYSIFDLHDPTNAERVAMLREGGRMIAAHPFMGLGPNMVEERYAEYIAPTDPVHNNQHLHNVPLQIGAERGLAALGVWMWFVMTLIVDLTRKLRGSAQRLYPAAGLAAIAAMLMAGFFEYNFGDSEFLMLFLVLVTLPYAADRSEAEAPVVASRQ